MFVYIAQCAIKKIKWKNHNPILMKFLLAELYFRRSKLQGYKVGYLGYKFFLNNSDALHLNHSVVTDLYAFHFVVHFVLVKFKELLCGHQRVN